MPDKTLKWFGERKCSHTMVKPLVKYQNNGKLLKTESVSRDV